MLNNQGILTNQSPWCLTLINAWLSYEFISWVFKRSLTPVTRLITLTSSSVKRYRCLKHIQEFTSITIIFSFSFETNKIKNNITSNLVFDTRGTEEQMMTLSASGSPRVLMGKTYDGVTRHIYCRCYDESGPLSKSGHLWSS